MYKGILVCLDGSQASRRALNYAIEIGLALKARIYLLHVITMWSSADAAYSLELEKNGKAIIKHGAAKVSNSGLEVRELDIEIENEVPKTIIRVISEHNIDLLVMGSHGKNAFERMMVGSVTEALVKISPVPIVVLRQKTQNHSLDEAVDYNPLRNYFGKILMCYDGSYSAFQALRTVAIPLAKLNTQSQLYLHFQLSSDDNAKASDDKRKYAEEKLALATSECKTHGLANVVTQVNIGKGPVSDNINHVASAGQFDIIVAGTRGESGLKSMLIGSVTTALIRVADAPLWLVSCSKEAAEDTANADKE